MEGEGFGNLAHKKWQEQVRAKFKGGIRGKILIFLHIFFFYVLMVYMYLEQDSQVLEQLKMSISRYTYFYIMDLCHSIYFTLPRGGSSPPLVHLEEMIPTSQYLYIISKCSSFQALLPYQLKISIKTRGSGVCPVTREPKEILLCLERSLEADIPRKGGFPLQEEKIKIHWR